MVSTLVENFCSITGVDQAVAAHYLTSCQDNLEMALDMFLSSQSETDVALPSTPDTNGLNDVREPIPQTTEQLVEITRAEANGTMAIQQNRIHRSVAAGPFVNHRESMEDVLVQGAALSRSRRKKRTLHELFRPPLELMFDGTFDAARKAAQKSNKLLIVDLFEPSEFACQALNRDLWSNSTVQSVIQENFVFIQLIKDEAEGQRFICRYQAHSLPFIGFIDPVTGELLQSLSGTIDADAFLDRATEFPSRLQNGDAHGSVEDDSEPPTKRRRDSNCQGLCSHVNNISLSEQDLINQAIVDSNKASTSTAEPSACRVTSPDLSYLQYLGPASDVTCTLIFRLPDGRRDTVIWPETSQLSGVFLYLQSLNFPTDYYEYVALYPRRVLNTLESSSRLCDLGLSPSETIYVQDK